MLLISDRREFLYVSNSTGLSKNLKAFIKNCSYWEKLALNSSGEGSKRKGFH